MKKLWIIVICVMLSSLHAGPATARGETLRCGSKIVTAGMSMDDVRKLCGEPASQTVEEVPVRSGGRVTGTTEMHYWIYRRGSGKKPAKLQFDQQKLVSISYQ